MMSHRNFLFALIAIGISISFGAILPCRASSTQGSTELEFILSSNPMLDVPRVQRADTPSALSRTEGVKLLFVGAIRFYQRFISTQDTPACTFTPSCSQFGVESFRHFDFVRAILLTSDRLQRCNSVSNSPYGVDYRSGRLIDPIQTYRELLK